MKTRGPVQRRACRMKRYVCKAGLHCLYSRVSKHMCRRHLRTSLFFIVVGNHQKNDWLPYIAMSVPEETCWHLCLLFYDSTFLWTVRKEKGKLYPNIFKYTQEYQSLSSQQLKPRHNFQYKVPCIESYAIKQIAWGHLGSWVIFVLFRISFNHCQKNQNHQTIFALQWSPFLLA